MKNTKKIFQIGLLVVVSLVLLVLLFYHKVFFIRHLSEEEAEKYQKYEMLLNSKQEILEVCGYQEEPADLKIPAEKMEPLKAYIPMCKEMIEGSLYEKGGILSILLFFRKEKT